MQFKVKAGRFIFEKESNKVKVSKDKGIIHILRNQEQETHFKWANLETHTEEMDIIVFPSDAVFEPVVGKNNTFVLRFGMDDDRYFFWLQEKCDVEAAVKEINRLINYMEPEDDSAMDNEGSARMIEEEKPSQPEQKATLAPQPQINSTDFISKLAQGIAAATKKQHKDQTTAIVHLSEIMTPQTINTVLKQFSQQDFSKLLQFMPEQHKDVNFIGSTLRSPQFQQAIDVLSDALNSENAIPLFMELGLNQEFLQKNYGVEAFLLALVSKFKSNQ